MAVVLFIIILVAVFLAIGWLFASQEVKRLKQTHRDDPELNQKETIAELYKFAWEQTVKKRANEQKVLNLLQSKGELSNSDVREALGVSRSSVVRYMDNLEAKGKVEQVGETGQGVTYKLK